MKISPLPHQIEGIRYIEKCGGRLIIADEMGVGKTAQCLGAIKRNPSWGPSVVVTLSSVKGSWERTAVHGLGMAASICEGRNPPRLGSSIQDVESLYIINYDILRHWVPFFKAVGVRTLIMDECQSLTNPGAKRTKAAVDLARTCDHVIAASGTPLTNRPIELFPVLNMIWPNEFPSLTEYAFEFCNPRMTPWGWDFKGSAKLDVLHARLNRLGMIRRKLEDVVELQGKERIVVPCEIDDFDQYRYASTDLLGWLRKTAAHRVRKASKAERLSRVGYLLRLSAKLKMRAVVNRCNEFLENNPNEKLAVFVVHRAAIKVIKKRVPYKHVVIDGSVPSRLRLAAIDQFQYDSKTRLFIGNMQAAGIGTTITAASNLMFAEVWWKPGVHIQVEHRVYRIGQENKVLIQYLVAKGTIEERLCRLLQDKQQIISTVLDGDPEIGDFNLYEDLLKELEEEIKNDYKV